MKTGSSFKLSKEAKRALAIIRDPQQRGAWKKSLVQAEATAIIQARNKTKGK